MFIRWLPTFLIVACGLCASWAQAQSTTDRPRSLATRLAELRRGWAADSEPAADLSSARSTPAAPPSASDSGDGRGYIAIAAENMRNSLPRVNPRNLLRFDQTQRSGQAARNAMDQRPPTTSGQGYATGSTIGRSRTRPGSRSRGLSNRDIALDLGYESGGDSQLSNQSASPRTPRTALNSSADAPTAIVPMPGSQRAGSVLGSNGTTSRPATDSKTLPSAAEARADVERRRQLAAEQLRNDLIGSGAGSRDTRGFGFGSRGEAAASANAVRGGESGDFSTAADAARRASAPSLAAPVVRAKTLGPPVVAINASTARAIARLRAIELPVVEESVSSQSSNQSDAMLVMSGDSVQARRAFAAPSASPSDKQTRVVTTTIEPRPTSVAANVLATQDLPLLSTRVVGPRQIMVGHEARYTVRLDNRGRAAANNVVAAVSIPDWTKVVRTKTSGGVIQQADSGIEWRIDHVAGQHHATLELVLLPTAAKPIELAVSAHHEPVGTTTLVEVQEPKLDISVSGPDEVFFGRPQTYRLTLGNPGTGVASNISVAVAPPGAESSDNSYQIEHLAPGQNKTVEFVMTARQAGRLEVRAVAEADGGLRAEAEQPVFCRKAELEVDWRGPARKYAGTSATYYFRVRNTGTAAAEKTTLSIVLPPGFEMQNATKGAQHDGPGRRVVWPIGTVESGGERYLELAGIVNEPGENGLAIVAQTASGEATDRATATTNVVAVADLKLEVADPKGPLPVGRQIEYEIAIINRGRSAAENVQVVALFSEGIEPQSVEGATASIANGRVAFPAIPMMEPGARTSFRITAKSLAAGTHLFRAEVLCSDLDIKLAAEESTQFYVDENPEPQGSSEATLGGRYQPTW